MPCGQTTTHLLHSMQRPASFALTPPRGSPRGISYCTSSVSSSVSALWNRAYGQR
jgi:hypothetical protein